MGLDDSILFFGQAARLIQDLIRDHDLADIVQGRRRADEGDIALVQLVTVGLAGQLMQQKIGQGADMQHMLPALAVAKFYYMAQDADHQHAVVLFFVDLIGHKAGEPLLFGVEHEHVLHPAHHHDPLERAADIICHAQIIGALDAGRVLGGTDHNDRDLFQPGVAPHDPQHIKAVHFRHDQVQQHQRNICAPAQDLHCTHAVFRFQIFIAVAQNFFQQGAVDLRIIHDQDFLFWVHAVRSLLFSGSRILRGSTHRKLLWFLAF